VAGIAGVVTHPLTSWVVSVLYIFSLSGDVSHFGWSSNTAEESGWGAIN